MPNSETYTNNLLLGPLYNHKGEETTILNITDSVESMSDDTGESAMPFSIIGCIGKEG